MDWIITDNYGEENVSLSDIYRGITFLQVAMSFVVSRLPSLS